MNDKNSLQKDIEKFKENYPLALQFLEELDEKRNLNINKSIYSNRINGKLKIITPFKKITLLV